MISRYLRLLFITWVLMGIAVNAEDTPGIPASALRGSMTVYSAKPGTLAFLAVAKNPGMYHVTPFSPTMTYWATKPNDATFSVHQWTIDEKTKKSHTDGATLVYDLTGKETALRYQLADDRWASQWTKELHREEDKQGRNVEYQQWRVASGEHKGWYLSFREEAELLPGLLGKTVPFHAAHLVKVPDDFSRLHVSKGRNSGVSP